MCPLTGQMGCKRGFSLFGVVIRWGLLFFGVGVIEHKYFTTIFSNIIV